MAVIGVLGHTDHGKSTLLEKLTGTNPMHLPEEKARGLTIQLGFAFLDASTHELPTEIQQKLSSFCKDGKYRISFIDVPGHEMFLRNMLRGILGIDAAVLVVSADDGIMPGTIEHLRASLYSAYPQHEGLGLILISKADLVTQKEIEEVKEELSKIVKGSYWEKAEVLTYSAETMQGLDMVRKKIIELALKADEKMKELDFSYYFVDRVFSVKGYGSVVTGTLRGRELEVGQELYLYPKGIKVKVRSLEQGGLEVTKARFNFRTAINLAGARKEEIASGDIILSSTQESTKGCWLLLLKEPEGQLKASPGFAKIIKDAREKFNLFVGSRLITPLEIVIGDAGNGEFLSLLREETGIPLLAGIPVILYRPSTRSVTIGGWAMPAPFGFPRRRKLAQAMLDETTSYYKRFFSVCPEELKIPLCFLLTSLVFRGFTQRRLNGYASLIPADAFEQAFELLASTLPGNDFGREDDLLYSRKALSSELDDLKVRIGKIITTKPTAAKIPLESVVSKNSIFSQLSDETVAKALGELNLKVENRTINISEQISSSLEEEKLKRIIMQRFSSGLNSYPTLTALREEFPAGRRIISLLISRGELVHLGQGVLITAKDYRLWGKIIGEHLEKSASLSISEAKQLLRASRKYVIPFLEHLDSLRITVRQGEARGKGKRFSDYKKLFSEEDKSQGASS